jgi:hypothetical protein
MADKNAIIRRYGRAVAHMRQAVGARRLGLCLGAGVSLSVGFPTWTKLLADIYSAMKAQGMSTYFDAGKTSEPIQAQILFAAFREHMLGGSKSAFGEGLLKDAEVIAAWRRLVHRVLYASVPDPASKLATHPYIRELASVARRMRLVVTYNFDDLLEQALAKHQKEQPDSRTVGYVSAWGPNFVINNDRPVVYHPNGFLPFQLDRASERVILTEEALTDQALDYSVGSYQTLLGYFSRTPVLILGSSLADASLRSLLRQALRTSPGNVHYCVHYCGSTRPSEDQQREIAQSNFDLYGIVTLFLDNDELRDVLNLIVAATDDEFIQAYAAAGTPAHYRYYVAGVVSSGKTTAISMLKGTNVVDEWLAGRERLIAKPSSALSADERKQVDDWIMSQLLLKNRRFRLAEPGVHIMDRAPLDAFAFTEPPDVAAKAEMLWDKACAGGNDPFVRGRLILMTGRPEDLAVRERARGRPGERAYLEKQQTSLMELYSDSIAGVRVVDAGGSTIETVARELARAIHFETYDEFDFDGQLKQRRA